MTRWTVLLLIAASSAKFGEREGTVDALHAASHKDAMAEDNARLRAEVASLRKRLKLPPPATAPGAPMAVVAALTAVRDAKAAMLAYYEGDADMLLRAPLHAAADDALLVARAGLTAMGLRRSIVGIGKAKAFVIGVTGSSVSAGHDSFGQLAWPRILEDNLKPLWAMLGVDLQVRNGAVGGRNPNPWPFCLAQIVGRDADVVIREAEYWPWAAGFAPSAPIAKPGAQRDAAAFEIFLRQARSLPRAPAVHFLRLAHGVRHHRTGFPHLKGAYGTAGINAFDSFGVPFDHLLDKLGQEAVTRAAKNDEDNWPIVIHKPCREGYLGNVAECPVNLEKQDGYHTHAKRLGYDAKRHPEYEMWMHRNRLTNLFINWHMGPLGHEVVGNQIAYYHMTILEIALTAIAAAGSDVRALRSRFKRESRARALPAPVACSDIMCPISTTFAPQCAYSFLPKAQGPDVGNWVSGRTAWVNAVADGQAGCDKGLKGTCEAGTGGSAEQCFRVIRACSYLDSKRGMRGDVTTGNITLAFRNMFQCLIWIGEPSYGWNKPKSLANWAREIRFHVNGRPCAAPNCTVVKGNDHPQYVSIDARAIMGSTCRREDVEVTLEVVPVPPLNFTCDTAKCSPGGVWDGYGPGMCAKGIGDGVGGRCTKIPRYRKKKDVHTFISYAIAF